MSEKEDSMGTRTKLSELKGRERKKYKAELVKKLKNAKYLDFCDILDELKDDAIVEKLSELFQKDSTRGLADAIGVKEQAVARAKNKDGKVPDRWLLYAAAKYQIPYHTIIASDKDEVKMVAKDPYVWLSEVHSIDFTTDETTQSEMKKAIATHSAGGESTKIDWTLYDFEFSERVSYRKVMINKSLVGQPSPLDKHVCYRAKATSMEPTIRINDFMFVEKFDEVRHKINNNGVYLVGIKGLDNNLLLCRIGIEPDAYRITFDNKHVRGFEVPHVRVKVYGRVYSHASVL